MLAKQCVGIKNVRPVGFKKSEPALEVRLRLVLLSLLVAVDKKVNQILSICFLVDQKLLWIYGAAVSNSAKSSGQKQADDIDF